MKCAQCGNPGMIQIDEVVLCLDCNLKYQRARQIDDAINASEINYLHQFMQYQVGFTDQPPVRKVSPSTIHTGPIMQHRTHIENSVVGAINYGQVEQMTVNLERIQNGGDTKLADAIRILAKAVIDSKEMQEADKNRAIDHINYLAAQAGLPREQRQATIGSTIIDALAKSLTVSAELSTIWQVVGPYIQGIF